MYHKNTFTIWFFLTIFISSGLSVSVSFPQDRDSWQQPERVMDAIGVKAGMTIGEVGAGRGYFTFKLARRVGDEGRIYANDIDEEALKFIEGQSRNEGITNIEIILGKVDDPIFPEKTMDMVFMSFVFHMLEKPVEMMKNVKPTLKSGATVIILDFNSEESWTGPGFPYPENKKIVDLVTDAGYELDRIETFLDGANIYIFRPRETCAEMIRPQDFSK